MHAASIPRRERLGPRDRSGGESRDSFRTPCAFSYPAKSNLFTPTHLEDLSPRSETLPQADTILSLPPLLTLIYHALLNSPMLASLLLLLHVS
jgi:hypothetical protein